MRSWEDETPRYTRGKQGHEGVYKGSQKAGERQQGHAETTSFSLFLKGTVLLLMNVFKCLEDEKFYMLS